MQLPGTTLTGEANLLVMPDISSANIAFQTIKVFGDTLPIGPILLGIVTLPPLLNSY